MLDESERGWHCVPRGLGQIEPTEGKIDWSYFDLGFELAKKYNKRIEIIVPAGKHSPEWVYAAGAEKFTFQDITETSLLHADTMGSRASGKIWRMIKKLGQRYDSSPYLSIVTMTGFGRSIEAWFAGPDDMERI